MSPREIRRPRWFQRAAHVLLALVGAGLLVPGCVEEPSAPPPPREAPPPAAHALEPQAPGPGSEGEQDLDALFRRALANDPNNAVELSDYANFLEQAGRYPDALAQLDHLRDLGQERHPDRVLRAGVLLKLGHYDQARVLLEALRSELEDGDPHGQQSRVLQLLGRAYTRLGMPEQAEAVLIGALEHEQAQQGHWNPACAYTALGELYRLEGRDEAGFEMLAQAADHEPGNAWIQYEAALFAYYSGDLESARRYLARAEALGDRGPCKQLRAALDGGPDQGLQLPEPSFDAALRAFDRYDFAQAEQLVVQALAQAPSSDAHALRAMLLVLRRSYPEARAELDQLGQGPRARRNQLLIEGHLALVEKDYPRSEAALRELDTELQGQPDRPWMVTDPDPWAWLLDDLTQLGLGWCAANQGRHELSLEHFARVLERKPTDIFALIGRGNSLNAMGDQDGAEAALRRVLEVDPDNAYAQAELGLVAYNRGQDEQAEAAFRKALEIEPETYTCPHEGLGLVYLRQGRLSEAQGAFERAIEINPGIEYLKYNGLARIYMQQCRFDEAARLIERSLTNAPWVDETQALRAELQACQEGEGCPGGCGAP
ncbi:MAG: tetratricopeptide repeat protein [Pseudomonadota bacterium]